jgi:hypothetical protein
MNRLMIQAVFSLSLCPLAMAQTEQAASPSGAGQLIGHQAADVQSSGAVAERVQATKNAQTICIHSETMFLTVSTLERALLKQKNWNRLGLNIVGDTGTCSADLVIDVDRVHFTHIHTYVVMDKSSGIVLAAGRVRALDGVVASGPMAEQIVKALSAARLSAQAAGTDHGM